MTNIRMVVTAFLVLAATSGHAFVFNAYAAVSAGGAAAAWGLKHEKDSRSSDAKIQDVSVTLFVTIPASRLIFRHQLDVPKGSTAGGILENAYPVKHALVCCDSRDVWAVNGIPCNPYQEKWWVVLVNGNKQNSSARLVLVDGDIVEWRFDEKTGHDPMHIRLEDWVATTKK